MGKDITEDMLRRMEEEAIYEMLHYHEKNGKQKIKDFIKRAAGRYVEPKDMIFWHTALIVNSLRSLYLIYGISKVVKDSRNDDVIDVEWKSLD